MINCLGGAAIPQWHWAFLWQQACALNRPTFRQLPELPQLWPTIVLPHSDAKKPTSFVSWSIRQYISQYYLAFLTFAGISCFMLHWPCLNSSLVNFNPAYLHAPWVAVYPALVLDAFKRLCRWLITILKYDGQLPVRNCFSICLFVIQFQLKIHFA